MDIKVRELPEPGDGVGWGGSSMTYRLWRGQGLILGRTFKLHVNTLILYIFFSGKMAV